MTESQATDKAKSNVKASNHSNYAVTTLVSVLIPVAGIIMGIIYLTKEKKLDRKLGEHLIAVGVLMSIVAAIGWYFLFPRAAYVPTASLDHSSVTPATTPAIPTWDVDSAYAKISKGMTKQAVETAIAKTPASPCTEQTVSQAQKYESCVYGGMGDNGKIIVTYLNNAVSDMQKLTINAN